MKNPRDRCKAGPCIVKEVEMEMGWLICRQQPSFRHIGLCRAAASPMHCSHSSAGFSCIAEDNVLSAESAPRCPAFHQLALQQFAGMLCSADLHLLCCSSVPCLAACSAAPHWHRCMPSVSSSAVQSLGLKVWPRTTVGRLACWLWQLLHL